MQWGNCLLYAGIAWIRRGGSIKLRVIRVGWAWKVRFYHVSRDGVWTYFAPLHPKRGLAACVHSIWYEGRVRHAN